jgi:hypothetical protein
MAWGVIGNALLRKCHNSLSCPIDLYCEDFMAFGVRLRTEFASSFIENFLRKVFHGKIVEIIFLSDSRDRGLVN